MRFFISGFIIVSCFGVDDRHILPLFSLAVKKIMHFFQKISIFLRKWRQGWQKPKYLEIMLKKSEVLREGYIKGLQKASSEIERLILEDAIEEVPTKKAWEKLKSDIMTFMDGNGYCWFGWTEYMAVKKIMENPLVHDLTVYLYGEDNCIVKSDGIVWACSDENICFPCETSKALLLSDFRSDFKKIKNTFVQEFAPKKLSKRKLADVLIYDGSMI